MTTPEDRLDALGIELPAPMKPVATYVPFVITGNLLFVSGQVSATPHGRINGRVGEDMELSAAQHAARQCGINLIAQCKAAVGDLMVEVFGDAGRHARSAVACPVLPMGVAVEVDGIFEITE